MLYNAMKNNVITKYLVAPLVTLTTFFTMSVGPIARVGAQEINSKQPTTAASKTSEGVEYTIDKEHMKLLSENLQKFDPEGHDYGFTSNAVEEGVGIKNRVSATLKNGVVEVKKNDGSTYLFSAALSTFDGYTKAKVLKSLEAAFTATYAQQESDEQAGTYSGSSDSGSDAPVVNPSVKIALNNSLEKVTTALYSRVDERGNIEEAGTKETRDNKDKLVFGCIYERVTRLLNEGYNEVKGEKRGLEHLAKKGIKLTTLDGTKVDFKDITYGQAIDVFNGLVDKLENLDTTSWTQDKYTTVTNLLNQIYTYRHREGKKNTLLMVIALAALIAAVSGKSSKGNSAPTIQEMPDNWGDVNNDGNPDGSDGDANDIPFGNGENDSIEQL